MIMKKVVINIVGIVLLALPCIWLAADSYFLQFLGLIYTYNYIRKVLLPVYKRVHLLFLLSKRSSINFCN